MITVFYSSQKWYCLLGPEEYRKMKKETPDVEINLYIKSIRLKAKIGETYIFEKAPKVPPNEDFECPEKERPTKKEGLTGALKKPPNPHG